MKKMGSSNVLIVGLKGLGIEIGINFEFFVILYNCMLIKKFTN